MSNRGLTKRSHTSSAFPLDKGLPKKLGRPRKVHINCPAVDDSELLNCTAVKHVVHKRHNARQRRRNKKLCKEE